MIETPKKPQRTLPKEFPFMRLGVVVQHCMLKLISFKIILVMGKICCYDIMLKYTPCLEDFVSE